MSSYLKTMLLTMVFLTNFRDAQSAANKPSRNSQASEQGCDRLFDNLDFHKALENNNSADALRKTLSKLDGFPDTPLRSLWKSYILCYLRDDLPKVRAFEKANKQDWNRHYDNCTNEEIRNKYKEMVDSVDACLHQLASIESNTPQMPVNMASNYTVTKTASRLTFGLKIGLGIGVSLILSGAILGGVFGWGESRWNSASQAQW